jgi:hypothetical protein
MYMLHCTIVGKNNIAPPNIMPFTEAVLSFSLLPLAALLRGALLLSLLASVLMFFRPLLSGLMRALVLTVRPRRAPKNAPRTA